MEKTEVLRGKPSQLQKNMTKEIINYTKIAENQEMWLVIHMNHFKWGPMLQARGLKLQNWKIANEKLLKNMSQSN